MPTGGGAVLVRISALLPGDSPRTEGIDGEHVARLAAVDERLPPILVRRSDLAVVDGRHRLRAARAQGSRRSRSSSSKAPTTTRSCVPSGLT